LLISDKKVLNGFLTRQNYLLFYIFAIYFKQYDFTVVIDAENKQDGRTG